MGIKQAQLLQVILENHPCPRNVRWLKGSVRLRLAEAAGIRAEQTEPGEVCDSLESHSLETPRQGRGGGGSGIRTHGTVSRTAVFKTAAINRSAIPPTAQYRIRI